MKYIAYWGDGYYQAPKLEMVDESFFTEEKNYSPENIEAIRNLEIHEIWVSDHPEEHYVIRVLD